MRTLLRQMQMEMLLLQRNGLITVSVAITGVYIGLFQLLKMLGYKELFAILLTLNDPALIALMFAGITIIFEREAGSLEALSVSPLNFHHYLLAKLGSLSILGTACGWAMAVGLLGMGIDHLGYLLACLLVSMYFGAIGVMLTKLAKKFIDFAMHMAWALVLNCLPLFDWFGVFKIPFKAIFPLEHGIRMMAWSFHYEVHAFPWLSFFLFSTCTLAFYFLAYRSFNNGKS